MTKNLANNTNDTRIKVSGFTRHAKLLSVFHITVSNGVPKVRDHWRKWEDNIKIDIRAIWINGANWIRLAQDRVQ
jgi:hypothetical protein